MMKIHRAMALPLWSMAAVALSLGGCKKVPNDATSASANGEANSETVGAALAADRDLSNAAALIRAADLDTTLNGPAPYTVFAPSNAALDALPAEVVKTLKTPAAKPQLTSLLTGHIVPGTVTPADLAKAIGAGGGSAALKTMAGDVLTFAKAGETITVAAPGGAATAIGAKPHQASNGVVYIIDGVLLRN